MTNALRAEWLKLVTTRAFGGILYGAAAAGVLLGFIGTAQGPPPWDVTEPVSAGIAWNFGVLTVTVLAVMTGSRTVTEEFDHDTIVHTFVADPPRRRSMIAKSAIGALLSIAVATVTALALAGTVYAMAAITGGDLVMYTSDGAAVLGLIGAASAMGVIGAGLGALVRHAVPAIVGALLWLLVAENVVGILAGAVSGYLPGKLVSDLAGVPQSAGSASLTVAAVAMATYAVLLAVAGTFEIRRRDLL
jgi:hypothetical protein